MIRILCPALLVLLTSGVHPALPGDIAAGRRLHDASCAGCHGAEVYTRKNRLVQSLPALKRQLESCNHMAKKRFSPAEARNIIKYLNDQYYHFERAAGKQEPIRARYDAASRIRPGVERDKRYAALAVSAAQGHDFELAIDIASGLSSAAERDRSYAGIVHQAILVRDFPAADKAARKMSSAALRDEQLKKIVGACPPNTVTK
jgi:hypothetical protein